VRFSLGLGGKRALVSGGTQGVGAAIVATLLDAGARVLTSARSVPSPSIGGPLYIAADLTTAEGCDTVAREVKEQLGGIDIIVNVLETDRKFRGANDLLGY
jgi:NAD(P)-dependent dehydrogenase (short-subunit alcohol dehydrogenase family)